MIIYFVGDVFFSGFHMMEEHEIMGLHDQYSNKNIASSLILIIDSCKYRLSPFLEFYLNVGALLLGKKMVLWHIFRIFIISLACTASFNVIKFYLKSFPLSFIIPLFLFGGTASEVIVRIATVEIYSILFLSLTFLRILKNKIDITLLVLLFLVCLIKENLILIIPFFSLIYIYHSPYDKKLSHFLKDIQFKKLTVFLLVCLVSMIIRNAYFISNQNESLYILSQLSLKSYLELLEQFVTYISNKKIILLEYSLFLILVLYGFVLTRKNKYSKYILISLVVIFISQFLLYINVGFSGRYFIPTNFTLLLGFVMMISLLNKIPKTVYFLVFILFSTQSFTSITNVKTYSMEGRSISLYLNTLKETCKNKPCRVLLVGDKLQNIEMFQALIKYSIFTVNDVNVKIKPLQPNIEQFMKYSNILDTSTVRYFEKSFDHHYKDFIDNEYNDINYDLIVYVGGSDRINYTKTPLNVLHYGERWFEFEIHLFK